MRIEYNNTFKVQYYRVVKNVYSGATWPVFESLLYYLSSLSIPQTPHLKTRVEKYRLCSQFKKTKQNLLLGLLKDLH